MSIKHRIEKHPRCVSSDCTPSSDSKLTWCSVCPKTLAAANRPKYCDKHILWCGNGDGARGAHCTARACPDHHDAFFECSLQLSSSCQPDKSRVSGTRRWCKGCFHWASAHDTLLRCKCGAARACKPCVKRVAPSHSRDTPWNCPKCSTTSDEDAVKGTGHNQAATSSSSSSSSSRATKRRASVSSSTSDSGAGAGEAKASKKTKKSSAAAAASSVRVISSKKSKKKASSKSSKKALTDDDTDERNSSSSSTSDNDDKNDGGGGAVASDDTTVTSTRKSKRTKSVRS